MYEKIDEVITEYIGLAEIPIKAKSQARNGTINSTRAGPCVHALPDLFPAQIRYLNCTISKNIGFIVKLPGGSKTVAVAECQQD